MEEIKTLQSYLNSIYSNSYWWISDEKREIILKYQEMGDIRAQMILMVDKFKKSPVIVDKKGKELSPLTKDHEEPINFLNDTIKTLENRDDISDLLKIKLENDFYNSKNGLLCCCYRALGHIYGGKWGKIGLRFDEGKKCYFKADELSGVETYETKLYTKEIVEENYFVLIKQQIDQTSPNDYIRNSVRKSGINSQPTDPDLHAEASGKDK